MCLISPAVKAHTDLLYRKHVSHMTHSSQEVFSGSGLIRASPWLFKQLRRGPLFILNISLFQFLVNHTLNKGKARFISTIDAFYTVICMS